MYRDFLKKKGLSLDRLHTLVQVADSPSLIAAAGNDAVRQSQFSRQLRDLENYFECALTRRDGRTLVMSQAGEHLARMTRVYLAELERFHAEQQGRMLQVRLGAGEGVVHWLIAPRLGALESLHSSLGFRFHNLRSHDILLRLHSHELDVGIVRDAQPVPSPLVSRSLGRMRYAFFVPEMLSGAGPERIEELVARVPLAGLHGTDRRRETLQTLRGEGGSPVRIRYECASLPGVARLIRTGRAGGLLPVEAAEEFETGTVRCHPLPEDSPLHETLLLVWNPSTLERFPLARKVLNGLLGGAGV